MSDLINFTYGDKSVRTITKDGEPWFVLKDVCMALEIEKHRDTASRLDDDERGSVVVDTHGGNQEMIAVSESGLYNVILLSRKPEAKAFKRWVTHEVLPDIRKHGIYLTEPTLDKLLEDPNTFRDLVDKYIAEKAEKKHLAEQNEILEIALNDSLKFYTVGRYNKCFKMGWNMLDCQKIGRCITAYCRSNSIEIRPCETNDERFGKVNSYPIAAWERFMNDTYPALGCADGAIVHLYL
jgi:prophage antirepressor-like protein